MKINQIYNPQEITDLAKLRFQEERAQDYLTGWFLAREIAMNCEEMFKDEAPSVYETLVHERDAYLAGRLMQIPQDRVIAVVGAGHRPGIERYLDNPETLPPLHELEQIETKR